MSEWVCENRGEKREWPLLKERGIRTHVIRALTGKQIQGYPHTDGWLFSSNCTLSWYRAGGGDVAFDMHLVRPNSAEQIRLGSMRNRIRLRRIKCCHSSANHRLLRYLLVHIQSMSTISPTSGRFRCPIKDAPHILLVGDIVEYTLVLKLIVDLWDTSIYTYALVKIPNIRIVSNT